MNLAAEDHETCQACLQLSCWTLAFLLKNSGRSCIRNSPLAADEYMLVIWSLLLSSWMLGVTEIHLPAFLLHWSAMSNDGS